MGGTAAAEVFREAQVGSAQVLKGGWFDTGRFTRGILTLPDVNHHLQRGFEAVDEPSKAVQPAATIIFRSPGEPDRAGIDRRQPRVVEPTGCRVAARNANHETPRPSHLRSLGRLHWRRYSERQKANRSAVQLSMGLPRQRPHAARTPPRATVM